MRIAHIITRMIVGGAQENTLLCCRDLMRLHGGTVRVESEYGQGATFTLEFPEKADLNVLALRRPEV